MNDSTRRTPPPSPTAVAPAPATVVKGLRPSTHTYATPLQSWPVVCTSVVTSNRPTVALEIDSRSTVPDQPRPSWAMVTVPTCTSPPAMCTVYVRSVTRDRAVPSIGTSEPDWSGTAPPGASCPDVTSTPSIETVQGPVTVAMACDGSSAIQATAMAADDPKSANARLMTAQR